METFVFPTYELRQEAENKLYDKFGGYVYESGGYHSDGYALLIKDDCPDYQAAWRICELCYGKRVL